MMMPYTFFLASGLFSLKQQATNTKSTTLYIAVLTLNFILMYVADICYKPCPEYRNRPYKWYRAIFLYGIGVLRAPKAGSAI